MYTTSVVKHNMYWKKNQQLQESKGKVLIATLKMLNLDTKREVKEEQELLKVRLN